MPSSSPHQEHPQCTALHAVHVDAGAVMTDFAGWAMPLRYTAQIEEHHAVRGRAGLFDLSHMAQIEVSGPAAGRALDRAFVSRCSDLRVGRARYTMMVAEDGGILDDLIVYRIAPEDFLVVANAANRDVVRDELTVRSGTGGPADDVAVEDRTEHRALLALQGPKSAEVLSGLTDADLGALRYYAVVSTAVAGAPALLARTGYTGEDGFELSVPAASAVELWRALEEAGGTEVTPCGLACRDSLRLEAGMPLYGNELSRAVTPYEAGAGRVVHLDHDFVGRAALTRRHEQPSGTVLAGLVGEGRRAARPGCTVHDGDSEVGTVTSGMLSPTLGRPVALALMEGSLAVAGTRLEVDVRGTRQPVTVVDPPFYRRPDGTRPTGRQTTRPAHEEHP